MALMSSCDNQLNIVLTGVKIIISDLIIVCILQVCVAGTTPPRQVRVPDRDGYHDDSDIIGDDVVIDDIRGTMMDYISHNAPHLQVFNPLVNSSQVTVYSICLCTSVMPFLFHIYQGFLLAFLVLESL